jgi:hypothetical protein
MDGSVRGMIFFETRHALRLGSDKTKTNLRAFQDRAFAQLDPLLLDNALIEFGYFADGNLNLPDALRTRMLDGFIENHFCGSLFMHRMGLYDMRFALN